jgi:hypothetical protein
MALKPADMESCDPKKKCLQGVNAGTAYTPGDECESGFVFDPATCECNSDTCALCADGIPGNVELCNYRWTDERGLTNVELSSYGEPLLSEPFDCGSTFCYYNVSQRKCDGTYGAPTPKLAYCNGTGCADDGIQLTGPVVESCSGATCDEALCPDENETFNCELCECVSEYWAWVGTVVNTGPYHGPFTRTITVEDYQIGGTINPVRMVNKGDSPSMFATSVPFECENEPEFGSAGMTAFNATARSTRLAKSCFGGSGNLRLGRVNHDGIYADGWTMVNGLNCSDPEGSYIEGTGTWVQVDASGNPV